MKLELGENDEIFSTYDQEIGSTRLADCVADLFAPAQSCFRLFAPTENKIAGNLQELPKAFISVRKKHPLDSR